MTNRRGHRVDQLQIEKKVTFPVGSVMEVYGSRGVKTTLQMSELAALDTLADELAAVSGLTATADELNRVADVSSRIVTIVETGDITVASNDGKVNLLGEVGGNALVTLTLPAATGSGARFLFMVSVVNTSTYVITVTGDDTIDGTVTIMDADDQSVKGYTPGAANDTITLNGTTTGGQLGDWVELVDAAADQWFVRGQLVCPAGSNPATPFSGS